MTDSILLILRAGYHVTTLADLCHELGCEPIKTGGKFTPVSRVAVEAALAELVASGDVVQVEGGYRAVVKVERTERQAELFV